MTQAITEVESATQMLADIHKRNLPKCAKCDKPGCLISSYATCEWCEGDAEPMFIVGAQYLCSYC